MTVPGMPGGMYQTNGLEHDETGRPSAMFVTHDRMNAKRYRKLEAVAKKYALFERFGVADPELGILCWGSSAGPVREAVERMNARMNAQGAGIAAFVPRILAPLPLEALNAFLHACSRVLIVETSFAGQFHRYLRSFVDLPRDTRVLARSGGKALAVAEIIEAAAVLQEVTA